MVTAGQSRRSRRSSIESSSIESSSIESFGGPNERVGDFLLHEMLGAGSFGHVVLGVHCTDMRRAAVKVLPKDATDEKAIRRVSGEISTMEQSCRGCPFIVSLEEVIVGSNHIYLIMEYADGGELFKAMFKPAGEPDSDVGCTEREMRSRTYFQQLVIGVQWCHQRYVAHRDLKPQNLLVTQNGVLKIADFGLAASLAQDPHMRRSERSMRQTMCGSPLYMAPELLSLRDGSSYNALATDVWSCAAVLYAMLFGAPPFPAASFNELVALTAKPRANLRLPNHVSRDLSVILRGMLRLDPKQRFQLPQVAQNPWFQADLAATLERAPNFKVPIEMAPRARAPSAGHVIGPSSRSTTDKTKANPRAAPPHQLSQQAGGRVGQQVACAASTAPGPQRLGRFSLPSGRVGVAGRDKRGSTPTLYVQSECVSTGGKGNEATTDALHTTTAQAHNGLAGRLRSMVRHARWHPGACVVAPAGL